MSRSTRMAGRLCIATALVVVTLGPRPAVAQNDWQFPDPYFGVFQHRDAGTPQAERRYRAEIAPQQPQRLHEQRPVTPPKPRPRWARSRGRPRP